MNLELWKIFYEVACLQNISKASAKLHISQPAITNHIKNLESILNCKLFLRSQKGVTLTKEGNLIFQDVKNALNLLSLAELKIKSEQELMTGTIRIGISTTLTKNYLIPFIEKFHKEYSNITFEISTDPTNILKESMKQGKIDFIIAKFPSKIKDNLSYHKLGSLEDVFVVNKKYENLINKELKLEDLKDYPILLQKQPSSSRDYFEEYCENNKIEMNINMEIASSNLLIEFAKIGYGIGFVTKEYVQKDLNKTLFLLDVKPKVPKRDFGIISLGSDYLTNGCDKFLSFLKENS